MLIIRRLDIAISGWKVLYFPQKPCNALFFTALQLFLKITAPESRHL